MLVLFFRWHACHSVRRMPAHIASEFNFIFATIAIGILAYNNNAFPLSRWRIRAFGMQDSRFAHFCRVYPLPQPLSVRHLLFRPLCRPNRSLAPHFRQQIVKNSAAHNQCSAAATAAEKTCPILTKRWILSTGIMRMICAAERFSGFGSSNWNMDWQANKLMTQQNETGKYWFLWAPASIDVNHGVSSIYLASKSGDIAKWLDA